MENQTKHPVDQLNSSTEGLVLVPDDQTSQASLEEITTTPISEPLVGSGDTGIELSLATISPVETQTQASVDSIIEWLNSTTVRAEGPVLLTTTPSPPSLTASTTTLPTTISPMISLKSAQAMKQVDEDGYIKESVMGPLQGPQSYGNILLIC